MKEKYNIRLQMLSIDYEKAHVILKSKYKIYFEVVTLCCI